MKIYKVKSEDFKGDQQWQMVWNCKYYWSKLNNSDYTNYEDIMNMETFLINEEHDCYVTTLYHLEPNKW